MSDPGLYIGAIATSQIALHLQAAGYPLDVAWSAASGTIIPADMATTENFGKWLDRAQVKAMEIEQYRQVEAGEQG